MAKRMLIDAAHPEETRVVVTGGTRLEEFDFESSTKKQVKGNIYLAKVTRVEPSLQAAFVDYGGNRHGFLAFSEIHPDYYRIPVSDRHGREFEPTDSGSSDTGIEDSGVPLAAALPEPVRLPDMTDADDEPGSDEFGETGSEPQPGGDPGEPAVPVLAQDSPADWVDASLEAAPDAAWLPAGAPEAQTYPMQFRTTTDTDAVAVSAAYPAEPGWQREDAASAGRAAASVEVVEAALREPQAIALRAAEESLVSAEIGDIAGPAYDRAAADIEPFNGEFGDTEPFEAKTVGSRGSELRDLDSGSAEPETVETLGGDEVEEVEEADAERRSRSHSSRHYKIQEVVKRRQIMLVQVAKEERGIKGAALTTYLSLAGRYCVLMPNTSRGGGVSRKIASIPDRRRLKEILEELEIPEGMGVIVRTAGAERSKAEIKRDYEYLLRLWNEIRDLTLKSTAPALIYEEGNLIKRSIRDLYTRDIDEVLVEGEEGYKTAKAFMRTLMPSHAKRVQPYRDPQIGLFHRFQIESQIDAIHSPVAQLRSGGYVVINQTEALVAIDVNSGRSTRERNIEETALRTNLEAAEEIARQLRLRDLAGLIVIDFIDMEEHRNQGAVERRLKEALKNDRARIQVGRISPFGLLEMSRQRLRPSLAEASTLPCPHCGGTGLIRSVESTALYVLRSIEEEGIRRRSAEICVYVPINVALYILNQKRESLNEIEARYGVRVMIAQDDSLIPPNFRLERLRPYGEGEAPPMRPIQAPTVIDDEEEEPDEADDQPEPPRQRERPERQERQERQEQPEGADAPPHAASETAPEEATEDERGRRRRRRRRRRPDDARPASAAEAPEAGAAAESSEATGADDAAERESESEAERRRRRRGRRGGRVRLHRDEPAETDTAETAASETIEIVSTNENERIRVETEALPPLETWSADAGFEAASLAPLAGEGSEPAPTREQNPEGDREGAREQPPEQSSERPWEQPPEQPWERTWEQARDEQPGRNEPEPEVAPTAEAEQGIPFVSPTERAIEEAAAMAHGAPHHVPQPQGEPPQALPEAESLHAPPAHGDLAHAAAARSPEDSLTVTEKPANPRRGWWQRLTQ